MPYTTISSREFARNLVRAKHAADEGPVVITELGKPAYALVSMEYYDRMNREKDQSPPDALKVNPDGL